MKKHLTKATLLAVALALASSCATNHLVWVKQQPANTAIVKNKTVTRDNVATETLPVAVAQAPVTPQPITTTNIKEQNVPATNTATTAPIAVHKNKSVANRINHTVAKVVAKVATKNSMKADNGWGKGGGSQLIALILCIVVGFIGIHRFYLGYWGIGVLELLTGGCCGILTIIDLIRIITGDLKPKDGNYDSTL